MSNNTSLTDIDRIELWKKAEDCCGCSACVSICPVKAIIMVEDERGFMFPQVDKGKCIKCKKCTQICAFKKDKEVLEGNISHIYAIKAADDIRKNSSSGGLFTVLADRVLRDGGAVVCATYNYTNNEVETRLFCDNTVIKKARGSKYIQSIMKDVFSETNMWIKNNADKKVLFVGTGCQAAGFREYAISKGVIENTIIVDLVCNGVPSNGLWKQYVLELEKRYKGKLSYVTFKDKRNGWHFPSSYGIIGEKEVSINGYTEWFYGGYSLRESCFNCPYTRFERCSDVTIGDCWGGEKNYLDFFDEMGVSLAITHTSKGQNLLQDIWEEIKAIEVKREECQQPRLLEPHAKPPKYDFFWRDIKRYGLERCAKKYKEGEEKRFTNPIFLIMAKIKNKLKRSI